MRIFDALNDIDNIRESVKMINSLGGISDTAVCYTVDPKDHTGRGSQKKDSSPDCSAGTTLLLLLKKYSPMNIS